MKSLTLLVLSVIVTFAVRAEDGYELWQRYRRITDEARLAACQKAITAILVGGESQTMQAVSGELIDALNGMLGKNPDITHHLDRDGIVMVGAIANLPLPSTHPLVTSATDQGNDGYVISTTIIREKKLIVITSLTDVGAMYGMFHFLRLIQTGKDISSLSIVQRPKVKLRILNHWDNLDRTVERGYSGFSLWDWHRLPDYIHPQYVDYARANASIGINGTVLTNVNANALVLTADYLQKVAALADVFRPYGIKVYLTARFSAPIETGGLKTADPLNEEVRVWWKKKIDEVYSYIPDFGGFLVKANSEGQPGPQNYGRTHADGANMLADALAPHGGIVMWRAFVYDNNVPDDRAKQAFNEFKPLDGKFCDNVLVQVKNGPIDFQPREPFHPLFGAMPKTPLMMEFQITQEYLGQGTHLVYLATMFKECLDSDTYVAGRGSTVAKVIDGTLQGQTMTGMAGVANIGTDRNWTGHLFGQANWYAFGRLAWDHTLAAADIAEEWARMTFTHDDKTVKSIVGLMMGSHETLVNYMTPLGLHHIMARGHHYGPGPWVTGGRPDWTSLYYHRADSVGVGFDRTASGSDAVSQYAPPVAKKFGTPKECPESLLLWFHRVPWDYKMKSGKILWYELVSHYYYGAQQAAAMHKTWNALEGKIDNERFRSVGMMLAIQEKEARWWRDACVLYFQTFSKKPIPGELEKPAHDLEFYQRISHPYAPGINPRW